MVDQDNNAVNLILKQISSLIIENVSGGGRCSNLYTVMDASVRSMVRVPRTNPKSKAGIFSRIFFVWLFDTIRQGYKDGYDEDDIPEAMPDHKSELLTSGLQKKWEKEIERAQKCKTNPSFIRAIIGKFGLEFFLMSLLSLIKDLVSVVLSPHLLGWLLSYFAPDSSVPLSDAILVAVGLCATNFVVGLLNVHFMNFAFQFGVRVRAACISMVYGKCLRLSQSALGATSSGQIINLVSNDVARFELVCLMMMPMLSAPVTSVILIYFLYTVGGTASLLGIGSLVLILVIQVINAHLTARYRVKVARRTDERVRLMDEIVLGIQVIKLYAWEKPFQSFIESARNLELKVLRKTSYLRATFMFFIIFTSKVGLFCTLLIMFLLDSKMYASSVFLIMVYFSQLANSLTTFTVRGFAEIAECMVSIRRIQAYLVQDEFKKVNEQNVDKERVEDSVLIEGELRPSMVGLMGVSAQWIVDGEMSLIDLNIDIRAGQLVAIIGTVGCGKSSLLNLLLGELLKTEGKMHINGVVSYAAQEPWIFSSSVRQNILFREDYNPARYKAVCRVCQLERDFELLPRGDKTLVGEKGASLSGGQKARINLARAIYKKADIYLLDDPLSAVDSHVGKQLFNHCIEDFLVDKTRILVTHQVQHLSKVNNLVLMEKGKILMQGTFKELRRSNFNFASVLSTPEQEKSPFQFLNVEPSFQRNRQRKSTKSERSVSMAGDEIIEYEEFENDREVEQTTHIPTFQVYQQYLRAGVSPVYCVVVAALFILTQILISSFDYWIAYWLHQEQDRITQPMDSSMWPSTTYLTVLGALLFGIFIIGNLRGLAYYEGCIRCSRGIHSQMFQSLITTSLSFFNNNPSGRILNRFSRDLAATDELLAKAVMDMGQAFGLVIGGLVIAISVNYWLSLPVLVLSCLLWMARRVCLKTSKNLKRIEGILRSPVYAHINASLQGLVTIRAHSAEKLLQAELSRYLDLHTSVTHIFYHVMSSLSLAQELVTNTYVTICILSFTLLKSDTMSTSAGLIITQSLTIMNFLQWGVKMSAEVANQMTSIERVVEYTQLEPEEFDQDEILEPDLSWPQFGMIEMRKVFMRYDLTEPYILRNLNFTILPKEKVGIVGRTGAGKSSLIAALFRLAPVEGSVIIDTIDTNTISLESLRSRISIIPQDPVLFSGTLRKNLDPFNRFSDAELYSVLHEVKLTEIRKEAQVLQLDSQVTEGGGNFSVGQRQLVCLARAILRNNKILVLDEATANVDPQTDALIQGTIRHMFAHCTVLTVAHRLHTIIDCDRVLVMDAGTVAEYDHPHLLLENREGLFSSLVQQTGPSMAKELALTAHQNYKKNESFK